MSPQRIPPPSISKEAYAGLVTYTLFVALVATTLIVTSENFMFRDFGDFSRVVGFMIPVDSTVIARRWPFHADGWAPIERFDLASYAFAGLGWLHSWYSDHFDLRFSSVPAKLLLIAYAHLIAGTVAVHFKNRWRARAVAFVALCVSTFYAHNIGMTKSFYAEYVFFLSLPLLLHGLLRIEGRRGRWAVVAASLVCGLAKVQYFYIPLLTLACLAMLHVAGRQRLAGSAAIGLVAAQALCLLPFGHNPFAQLNHHQSTYFGSYMMLSPTQQRELGLTEKQIDCIGIDAWGHKAAGPGGTTPVHVGRTCYGKQEVGLLTVLEPYARFPEVLPKLMAYALPQHFTVHYVHVFKYFPYLIPANGKSYRTGWPLDRLSTWRERIITPAMPLLLLLGLAQFCSSVARRYPGVSAACVFLSLFIASQIIVCLLGEGIRDLSKHLWAAQLALDFLVLGLAYLVALQFAAPALPISLRSAPPTSAPLAEH